VIDLSKPVTRKTRATIFERSKQREVIITLEPPSLIGFRLKGTRRTYYLEAAACYQLAVKATVRAGQRERRKKK